ncbi:MAG: class I SAM-dependent methyltransferase [Bdellovibrionota bacterium]
MAESLKPLTILILYTTIYRTGGPKFKRAARTMELEKAKQFPNHTIINRAVESKDEFLQEIENVKKSGSQITEFHFIGHSGVYGIMFGTDKWPEQFSPFEWRNLEIPFTKDGHFYFHACRSGRWFAPFISRTLGVKASGNYWYTTFSLSLKSFKWEGYGKKDSPLYVISCPGKKSHGVFSSVRKYLGMSKAIPMLEFAPTDEKVDASYDSVATLYDDTFDDITVRKDEWDWLTRALGESSDKKILDIGCGNGAFLQKLSSRIGQGTGVDISAGMLEQARKRCKLQPQLSFEKIDGPMLPFADNSFDSVISVLSFRYLDWDPILHEILRVLKPGGQFVVMDMVAAPVKLKEVPSFIKAKIQVFFQRFFQKKYWQALSKMVRDQRWQNMLKYNPMRSEHEMKWFLESRFPGQKTQLINIGWNSRILAFKSGPIHFKEVEKQVYP